jgi:hypothetical protein
VTFADATMYTFVAVCVGVGVVVVRHEWRNRPTQPCRVCGKPTSSDTRPVTTYGTYCWKHAPPMRGLESLNPPPPTVARQGKGWVAGSGPVPTAPPPPKTVRLDDPHGILGRSIVIVDGERRLMADRIAAVTIASRLRQAADWLDRLDQLDGGADDEHDAQDDLRMWADRLERTGRLP